MLTAKLTSLLSQAFEAAGYDKDYGDVVVSSRPDLCQFQCNGAMPAAKAYKKAPFMISDDVINALMQQPNIDSIIKEAVTVKPGFINITLADAYLAQNTTELLDDKKFGVQTPSPLQKIVMDYGGPNIAKPLHVGHLRTAIIGESLKRILRFLGHDVTADIHLGDWGLQMGMVISEIQHMYPDLPYFDPDYTGDYPEQAPVSLKDLEEIYPKVSALCKTDDERNAQAKKATYDLQDGRPGYIALWKQLVQLSVDDVKKNYQHLNVDFDLWYGESTSHPYIKDAVAILKEQGALYESDGAMIVDVAREDDKKEIPPIILFKSDGSVIYGTTDLATIYQRVQDFDPDAILYVVDSRQSTHFTQVFRCAKDHGIAPEKVSLEHIGFGTMNGKDGKPFKTRAGGVLRLSDLIEMIESHAREKLLSNAEARDSAITAQELDDLSHIIGLATLKFADLSNYRMKDYVFDLDKFSSFEGKTGPYILYSTVRIKNILRKLAEDQFPKGTILPPASDTEAKLMLKLDGLNAALSMAARDRAPNILCEYVYDLSTLISGFYHTHHILNEPDEAQKKSWHTLLDLTLQVQTTCIDLLGMIVPEKM